MFPTRRNGSLMNQAICWLLVVLAVVSPAVEAAVVNVTTASITDDTVWTANNTYVLNGRVYVTQGKTLTIQPGTVVKGKAGTGLAASALFICRGAKIHAEGLPDLPIIFTAESDDPTRIDEPGGPAYNTAGLWGGVVLLGRARLNSAAATVSDEAPAIVDVFEGLADDTVGGQK